MFDVVPLDTPSLGDRSYLVHDGQLAFVVDPQRDIDRVLHIAAALGVRITDVFETHIHNDYVTGGRALAAASGATYHVNGDDPTTFERSPIAPGDIVEVSPILSVQAVATPGHTFTHLAFTLIVGGEPVGVFTGGSLLYGTTGRPDLLGPGNTDALVRAQWRSAHLLADQLPDATALYPTHGFGSFCAASQSEGTSSTIGPERHANPALTGDEDRFVADLLAGLDAFPAYYAHMAPANLEAPARPPDLSPPVVTDPIELRRRTAAGEWVVDLRNRTAFAAGHLAGTLNFGLDGSFATYLGWLIPWGTPLTVLAQTGTDVAKAQRELVRIGIDRLAGAAVGAPGSWTTDRLQSRRTASFADLAAALEDGTAVLDVRRDLEWAESHIVGGAHPFASARRPDGRDPCRPGVGALPVRIPGVDRRLPDRQVRPGGRRRRRRLRPCGRYRHRRHPHGGSVGMSLTTALKDLFAKNYRSVTATEAGRSTTVPSWSTSGSAASGTDRHRRVGCRIAALRQRRSQRPARSVRCLDGPRGHCHGAARSSGPHAGDRQTRRRPGGHRAR